ncbi:hypothetical protein AURDEDRAFT_113053 [Auricularia subglabra TFB-10046 SS5]|nr:hypothetical protein AURDEDRAFT_113053 [Auricularia subglabra TFB-10046 SS5]
MLNDAHLYVIPNLLLLWFFGPMKSHWIIAAACLFIAGSTTTASTPRTRVKGHREYSRSLEWLIFSLSNVLVYLCHFVVAGCLLPGAFLVLVGASLLLGPVILWRCIRKCTSVQIFAIAGGSALVPPNIALGLAPLLLIGTTVHWFSCQYWDIQQFGALFTHAGRGIVHSALSPTLRLLDLVSITTFRPWFIAAMHTLVFLKIVTVLLMLLAVYVASSFVSRIRSLHHSTPPRAVVPTTYLSTMCAPARPVTLVVRGLHSKAWTLTIPDTSTISQVLHALSSKYNLPLHSGTVLCLSSRFRPLAEHEQVRTLGLDTLSVLTLCVRLPGGAPDRTIPNPAGKNQWGGSWLKRVPELPEKIQRYLNLGKTQAAIVIELRRDLHGTGPSLKTVQNIIREHGLTTSRRPQCTAEEAGAYIIKEIENDEVRRTGYRTIHENLRREGVHMPRDFVETFLRAHEPEKVDARYVDAGEKLHTAILTSPGPNAEWSCDGHDKLIPEMNIGIWGGIDKFSRRIVGYFAVPTYKTADLTRALYLRLVKQEHGIPFQLSLDKGSETGQAAAIQTVLRLNFDVHDIEVYPAHRGLQSTKNITVERGWRPLFSRCLQNILVCWMQGKHAGTYHPENEVHQQIARWVWGQVVQHELDRYVESWNNHRIRKQKRTKLPSGGTPNDFFYSPWDYNGQNFLVRVDASLIDDMLDEYTPPNLYQWASPPIQEHCERAYGALGSPTLDLAVAWPIIRTIITALP